MSLNCVEIEEIIKTVPKSGIVKKFFQPDKNTLIMIINSNLKDFILFINTEDKYNRIFLTDKIDHINIKNNRFSEFLNSNFSNCKLKNIFQYKFSRIIVMDIIHYEKEYKFAIRLWGTGSNIILLDENNDISDCLKRFPKRKEWPGESYDYENKVKEIKPDEYAVRKEFTDNDINHCVKTYYDELIKIEENDKNKNKLLLLLNNKLDYNKSKLKALENNKIDAAFEKYKKYGEILKNNYYLLKKGLKEIELFDYESNDNIKIKLSENFTPNQNIEKYFNMYKKLKNNMQNYEIEKKKYTDNINLLENKIALLHNSEEIKLITDNKILNKKDKNSKDYKIYYLDSDFIAYTSKDAKNANILLSKIAKGNDYWFHVRDTSGCHVIVKNIKGKTLTEKAKLEAGNLAVYFSKARKEEESDVYFTYVKYLHKSKGADAGLVFPTQEKNIRIKIDKDILNQIFSKKQRGI